MDSVDSNVKKVLELLIKYKEAKSLPQFMDIFETLSIYSVYIGENKAELDRHHLQANYDRKISVSRSFLVNRAQKISEKTSLEMANEENSEKMEKEIEIESLANRLDLLLRQTNRVLDCLRSRISYEKAEKNRTMPSDL